MVPATHRRNVWKSAAPGAAGAHPAPARVSPPCPAWGPPSSPARLIWTGTRSRTWDQRPGQGPTGEALLGLEPPPHADLSPSPRAALGVRGVPVCATAAESGSLETAACRWLTVPVTLRHPASPCFTPHPSVPPAAPRVTPSPAAPALRLSRCMQPQASGARPGERMRFMRCLSCGCN